MAGYRARESWSVYPAIGGERWVMMRDGLLVGRVPVLSWPTVESMVSWSWRWDHALVSLALGVLESVLAHR